MIKLEQQVCSLKLAKQLKKLEVSEESLRMKVLEEENIRLKEKLKYPDSLTLSEYKRLIEWMNNPNRKPAHVAFTASACRDAARAFESSVVEADNKSLALQVMALQEALKEKEGEGMNIITSNENNFGSFVQDHPVEQCTEKCFDRKQETLFRGVKKKLIAIRFPVTMLLMLKTVANKSHGHYQSLIVHYCREGLKKENELNDRL
ncbi:copg antitoxin of type II toxin-antitoxin system [Caudoviricetes sp.]|nr:copg antitoxin of type II toxin-antitoxin system [Caudoviricetes sp.]UOF81002.1 copg antitoxin of type II toxin-antitoxin system [Caudoviricetes sp.]UOF81398.1 copg antitoxin of type II toxin-antitoxin system [Caudoviricetes sp.]